jgi:hypothetical protein
MLEFSAPFLPRSDFGLKHMNILYFKYLIDVTYMATSTHIYTQVLGKWDEVGGHQQHVQTDEVQTKNPSYTQSK